MHFLAPVPGAKFDHYAQNDISLCCLLYECENPLNATRNFNFFKRNIFWRLELDFRNVLQLCLYIKKCIKVIRGRKILFSIYFTPATLF